MVSTGARRGKPVAVRQLEDEYAAAIARHPSVSTRTDAEVQQVIWRQLGLPGIGPDDQPMRLRRPQSAARVRQLRSMLG